MFSENTDFTPNFCRLQTFVANIFRTKLELVESYSEHYDFWYLGLRYRVDIPMDMPWKYVSKGMTIHWESHFIPFDDIPHKYGLAGCKTPAECFSSWVVF